ncbi:MAG: phosphonate C-P lyase system protein PhnH [Caldilineaceae bacterium]|nr:phosphonate C-P lyase system protein PhnH [Caldilineaceae bacterium]
MPNHPVAQLPSSTVSESMARATFQGLLAALSNPGRVFTLSGPTSWHSCQQIGQALLDLETSFFTPDPALAAVLAQSGARALAAAQAAYHFFPDSAAFAPPTVAQSLATLAESAVGLITDPDEGATIIVACHLGKGRLLQLRGPGIAQSQPLRVAGLPTEFWRLRAAKIVYPLGIDLFLVDGSQLVGLPRTTLTELL